MNEIKTYFERHKLIFKYFKNKKDASEEKSLTP